jgi:hypothetical protein
MSWDELLPVEVSHSDKKSNHQSSSGVATFSGVCGSAVQARIAMARARVGEMCCLLQSLLPEWLPKP